MGTGKHKRILAAFGGMLFVVANMALGIVGVLAGQQWMSGTAVVVFIVVVALYLVPVHLRCLATRIHRT